MTTDEMTDNMKSICTLFSKNRKNRSGKSICAYIRPTAAILVVILCLFTGDLSAQSTGLSSLNHEFLQLSALSGEFKQENFDLLQDRKSKASGQFSFLKPGLMRWVYTNPDPYTIVVGQQKIWIYDPILENVTIHQTKKVRGLKTISMLMEPENLKYHYKIIQPAKLFLDIGPGDKFLALAYKQPDPDIAEIQLAFAADFRIKQFVIVETNRNYRKIELLKLDFRPRLSPADFEFKIPHGVEIIDKSGKDF